MQTTAIGTVANSLPESEVISLTLLISKRYILFAELDNYHRFVKSDKYKKEKEWRLIHKYNGRLNLTKYGDRSAAYHDFKFEANKLKDLGIELISVDLGPCYTKENTPSSPSENVSLIHNTECKAAILPSPRLI